MRSHDIGLVSSPLLFPFQFAHDSPVTATASGDVATTDGAEHDGNLYMPEDFFEGIKGARYSHYGQYISGYADSFEELQTVLDRHAQVCVGGGGGTHRTKGIWTVGLLVVMPHS